MAGLDGGGSLPYPPQDCPCRDCRVNSGCGRQPYAHGGGGVAVGVKEEPDISKPDFIDYDERHDILFLGFGARSNSIGDEADDDFTVMRDCATGKIVGLIMWGFWEKHKGALAAKLKAIEIFPQNTGPHLAGGKIPVEIVNEERLPSGGETGGLITLSDTLLIMPASIMYYYII